MNPAHRHAERAPETLDTFQASFWKALWAETPDTTSDVAAQPGFAVYRNTVLKGCADALLSLYPAVHRLTGDTWMNAVALDFARTFPPTGGDLQHFGERFPTFVAEVLPPGELPWLGEVARADRLWNESHVAADAPVFDMAGVLAIAPDRLAGMRLRVHPATRWHWSAHWPVFSLWHAAREHGADPDPPHWHGEGVVLTRPDGAVLAQHADEGTCALLNACAEGLPLADALEATQTAFPSFDPGAALGRLLQQGAFRGAEEITP